MQLVSKGRAAFAALIATAVVATALPLVASASDVETAGVTGTGYYGGTASVEFIRDGVKASRELEVLDYYPPDLTTAPDIKMGKARRPFKVRVRLKASHNMWMSPENSMAASCRVAVRLVKPNGKRKTLVVANPMNHPTTEPLVQTFRLSKWWRYKATKFVSRLTCRPHEAYGHY